MNSTLPMNCNLQQVDDKLTEDGDEDNKQEGEDEIPHGADLFSAHDFDVQIDVAIPCKGISYLLFNLNLCFSALFVCSFL